MNVRICRRTFEAAKHPPGSEERTRLNLDWRTSEYLPSYKYGLTVDGGRPPGNTIFKRKRDAIDAATALIYRELRI